MNKKIDLEDEDLKELELDKKDSSIYAERTKLISDSILKNAKKKADRVKKKLYYKKLIKDIRIILLFLVIILLILSFYSNKIINVIMKFI